MRAIEHNVLRYILEIAIQVLQASFKSVDESLKGAFWQCFSSEQEIFESLIGNFDQFGSRALFFKK